MGTESRIEAAGVTRLEPLTPASRLEIIERLFAEPYGFGFYQAVQLLERHFADRTPVGGFGDPATEAVRFRTNPSVSFPASEIHDLQQPSLGGDDEVGSGAPLAGPPEMMVNFFGLTGPQGVLPLPYLLYVAERERFGDGAMRAFFDIFNHRALSLLHRAWESRRAAAVYGRGERDWATRHLLDVAGLGVDRLIQESGLPAETLIFYAGLLSMSTRPAIALEQLLEDHFEVPVAVEQFVGGWYRLDGSAQLAVGGEEESSMLGGGAVGDEIWDQQGRIRIRLGPLTRSQYDRFLPGGEAYAPLRALVRFFTGDEIDFELQLVLARDEVPMCVLGDDDAATTPLGWCTWLRTRPLDRDADEAILTP
jgi:type VI secretion system protein ImpH